MTATASPEDHIAKDVFLTTHLEYKQFVPSLLHVSLFWISATKMEHRIIRQCVCEGRLGHPKVLDAKPSRLMNNELYMVFPVTV